MENELLKKIVQVALDEIKGTVFVKGYQATDEEAFGMLISKFSEWDGLFALKACGYALEDSNFHKENAKVQEIIQSLK